MPKQDVVKERTEEEVQNIADSIEHKDRITVEEMTEMTTKVRGDAVTDGGIIIPVEVLAKLPKTKFHFVVKYSQDSCEVIKIDPRGTESFVRTYERTIHGDGFKELAEQFVTKFNNR